VFSAALATTLGLGLVGLAVAGIAARGELLGLRGVTPSLSVGPFIVLVAGAVAAAGGIVAVTFLRDGTRETPPPPAAPIGDFIP
jgi:hypothetical protein